MDKEVIVRNFSRYAYTYDKYAQMQRMVALRLKEQIREDGFKRILEIGCGTGNYTQLLREKFRNAKLKALDISDKMIEVAQQKLKDKEIEFIVADAETANLNEVFDLITSNACFQWFENLEKALIKYKNLLKTGGVIAFSIFGPFTFWELNSSLKYNLKVASIAASNFITIEKLEKILNQNFNAVRINEVRYRESFLNLRDLLNKIKYMGMRGNGLGGNVYFNRIFLKKLEETYLDKFKQIKATYQVFFCRGIR